MLSENQIRFDNNFCPNAMHGKFELLSLGKASSHSTALLSFPPPPPSTLCAICFRVSIPPGCEAYSFMSRTHKGGSGTNKSAQEQTRRDRKTVSPCPARGSNPGSTDLNSDALTTELHPHHSKHTCVYEKLSLEGVQGWGTKSTIHC